MRGQVRGVEDRPALPLESASGSRPPRGARRRPSGRATPAPPGRRPGPCRPEARSRPRAAADSASVHDRTNSWHRSSQRSTSSSVSLSAVSTGLGGVADSSVAAVIVASGTASAKSAKNARSSDSTVETSTERSRYLLPRSHEVSGRNRQAWQAAPWSVRPSSVGWCSAHSGSEAQSRIASSAWSRCRPSVFGSPRPTSPPSVPSLSGAAV